MTELEKIKAELNAISDKWENYVKTNIKKTEDNIYYWNNMKLLLQSIDDHSIEITKYKNKYISYFDDKERQYIETIIRDCLVRFDKFSRAVKL